MSRTVARRIGMSHLLLIGVVLLASLMLAQQSTEAQSSQTLRFVCSDRAGQLFIVGGSSSCPSGFTRVDLSGTSPAVAVCVLPITNTARLAGQSLPCIWPEQTVILHGPTETFACSSMSLNRSFRMRMRMADANGSCRSGDYLLRIAPGNPVAADDSYVTGFETTLTISAPGVLDNDSSNSGTVTGFDAVSSNGGTVNVSPDGGFNYTPPAGFVGTDSFGYTVSNGANASSAIVTIEVIDYAVANDDEYIVDDTFTGTVAAPGVLGNDEVNGATITAYDATTTAGGSVVLNADGSFTYTEPLTPVASDTFTYTLANPVGSSTATVTLTFNQPPDAVDDIRMTDEDTQLTVPAPGVLGNDTDPDLDPLVVAAVNGLGTNVGTQITLPSGALATVNADGSFTWLSNGAFDNLAAGAEDTDSFTYAVSDGRGGSGTTTVTIVVTGVNDAPTAVNDSYSVNEDATLNIPATGVLGNDTDVDGNPLTAAQVSGPAHGSLTLNPDGSFNYTPDTNYNGPDSFTYQVNDGTTDSNVATVNLTVDPVNDAPVASDDSYDTDGVAVLNVIAPGVLVNDADIDADPLEAVLVSDVTGGTLAFNPDGSFSYTAAPGTTSDSFTYLATDLQANSNVATVTIAINALPVGNAQSVSTDEDVPVTITLTASDADDEDLSFAIGTGPTNGTLGAIGELDCTAVNTCSATVLFTPEINFNRTDSFTVTVNDGHTNSAAATVLITVGEINDPPTASSQTVAVIEDTAASITLLGSDIDSSTLTYAVSPSSAGQLYDPTLYDGTPGSPGAITTPGYVLPGTTVIFVPAPNASGTDFATFTFTVSDGTLDSTPATVTIDVTAVNDAPTAKYSAFTTHEDTPLSITLDASDIDGGSLIYTITIPPTLGTLSGTAPNLTYTPNDDVNGPDIFTFEVCDSEPLCDTAIVSIPIIAVNDAPVLADIEATALPYTENGPATPITGTLTVSDIDSTTLAGATVTISSGLGAGDTLAFIDTTDITGSYNPGTGVLTLTGSAAISDYQAALRSVAFSSTSDNPGTSKTISFQVNDGQAVDNQSDEASREIAIMVVNDAPNISVPGLQTINEDTNLVINGISVSDIDAGTNEVEISLAVANGTITLSGTSGLGFANGDGTSDPTMTFTGTLTNVNAALNGMIYRGTQNFNSTRGTANLTIVVDDLGNTGGGAEGDIDSVAITVNAVNDAPIVPDRTFDARANLTLAIDNDTTQDENLIVGVSDPDTGDGGYTAILTASLVAGTVSPSDASVTIATDGDLTFTPPPGGTGDVTFTYEVCDSGNPGPASCAAATVTIDISGPVVWFISNGASTTGQNGTSAHPFSSISAYETVRTQPGSPIAAGSIIYIDHTGTNYTGPLTLLNNQRLIGEGATGGTFEQISGATTPPAGSSPYPTLSANQPVLTASTGTTLTLAANNTINGVQVQAASNAVAVQSTASVSGTVTFTSAPITQSGSGAVVSISNRTGGTITFAATTPIVASAVSNSGIVLADNASTTFAFNGGMTLGRTSPTVTGSRFSASNSGTVTIANEVVNTINAVGSTALNISSTTIGAADITFQSISANGGENGIVLSSTGASGGLTVTGTGTSLASGTRGAVAASLGSGGTIQSTTGDAIGLNNVDGGVTLRSMVIGAAAATTSEGKDAVSNVAGDGIDIVGSDNIVLENVKIARTGGHGIEGIDVTNFSMRNSEVINAGDANDEDGLNFAGGLANQLDGTVVFDDCIISASTENNIYISNASGTVTITVDNSLLTRTANTATLINGEEGLKLETFAGGSPSITATVTGSTFDNLESDGITAAANAGTITLYASTNTFTGVDTAFGESDNAMSLGTSGTATLRFNVHNNLINNSYNSGVLFNFNDSSIVHGIFEDNQIVGSIGNAGGRGIDGTLIDDNSNVRLRVDGNIVTGMRGEGMFFNVNNTATLNIQVTNNAITTSSIVTSTFENLTVQAVGGSASSADVVAKIENNTVKKGGDGGVGGGYIAEAIRLAASSSGSNTIQLEQGGQTLATAVLAVLDANNPGAEPGTDSGLGVHVQPVPDGGGKITVVANGTVLQPQVP